MFYCFYVFVWTSYTDNGNDNYDVYVSELESGKWFVINLDWNGEHYVYNYFKQVDGDIGKISLLDV